MSGFLYVGACFRCILGDLMNVKMKKNKQVAEECKCESIKLTKEEHKALIDSIKTRMRKVRDDKDSKSEVQTD